MPTVVQFRRGTTAQNNNFTGADGEISVDTTALTLRVHNGSTVGGNPLATQTYVDNAISSLSANSITDGTSSVAIISSNGNIRSNVAGSTVQTISAGLVSITGDLTVSGNATLSGNILGDRIQNGTTTIDIQTPSGNANITVGGTSNVAVFSTTGAYIAGTLGVTGNITTPSNVVIGSAGNSAIFNSTVNLEIQNNVSTGNINFRANVNGGGETSVLRCLGTGGVAFSGNLVSMFGNGAIANGISNIGSSSSYFNTVFAKATSAQYADLAEMYVADANYPAGTVVEFGGEYEITISSASHSTAVAGIISTNPSYLMNSAQTGEHVLPVALTGRVPCQVQGPVRKGDVLVASSTPGVAQRIGMNWQPGCILGKAMEVIDTAEIKTIEVAVGRT